jgi:hypothetical protein
MRVQLLLVVMLGMQYSLLNGMNILLSTDDHNIARDVVVAHCLAHDDYDTYRNVAMLSKAHNRIIEGKYRPKKKIIEEFIKWKTHDVTGYTSWNKDFSKCAWVTICDSDSDKKNLQLTLVGLVNDNVHHVMSSSRLWRDFSCPVFEDNMRPCFDTYGRAFFYGYGNINPCWNGASLTEYSISLDGEVERYYCGFVTVISNKYGHTTHIYPGNYFFNCPVLLKAWLQSKEVRIYQFGNTKKKSYDIQGVTLPDDYKTFKKHVGLEHYYRALYNRDIEWIPYNCLLEELRQGIDNRYKEQQREKNSSGDEK